MTDQFADRHIGIDSVAQLRMLEAVGYDTVEALMDAAVPTAIRLAEGGPSTIPEPATEREALDKNSRDPRYKHLVHLRVHGSAGTRIY